MDVWTKTMGYPYLKVISETWNNDNVVITLEQNWFLADGSASQDESPLWQIPLQFATQSGIYPSENPEIMTTKQQTFTIPLTNDSNSNSDNAWIKINAEQNFLVRVEHSNEMFNRMLPALKDGTLSAIDRAAVLNDSYNLAKAGLSSIENVIKILLALENETSSVVFGSIATVLSSLHVVTEQISETCHQEFIKLGKRIVLSALNKCGWDSKITDQHTEKLYRSTCIALLDSFASDDMNIFNEAKRRFDLHFTDNTILPSDYKTTVYKILLKSGGIDEYEAILKTFNETEDNSIRKYAMSSLGATKNTDLKLRTLDWAIKSGDVKLQDFFYPIGSVTGDINGGELAWKYFQDNFDYIKDKVSKANSSLMDAAIMFTCSRFCTEDKVNEITVFFEANPLPKSERRISQLLETMKASATFVERTRASNLEAMLKSL
jgi:puromycin-sensitive aminopeptidase